MFAEARIPAVIGSSDLYNGDSEYKQNKQTISDNALEMSFSRLIRGYLWQVKAPVVHLPCSSEVQMLPVIRTPCKVLEQRWEHLFDCYAAIVSQYRPTRQIESQDDNSADQGSMTVVAVYNTPDIYPPIVLQIGSALREVPLHTINPTCRT